MLVYISQPMNNRDEQEIETSRAYAIKKITDAGSEVKDDYIRDESNISRDTSLVYLSESLKKMSECDAVYFIDNWETSPRCRIERAICEAYGFKIFEE